MRILSLQLKQNIWINSKYKFYNKNNRFVTIWNENKINEIKLSLTHWTTKTITTSKKMKFASVNVQRNFSSAKLTLFSIHFFNKIGNCVRFYCHDKMLYFPCNHINETCGNVSKKISIFGMWVVLENWFVLSIGLCLWYKSSQIVYLPIYVTYFLQL